MKKYTLILLSLSLNASAIHKAWSGQESHGGDLVICPNQDPVVLDYYHASLKTLGNTKDNLDLTGLGTQEVIDLFRSRMLNTPLITKFDRAMQNLGPVETWRLAPGLKDITDSGEIYFLPQGCKLVQGAARQGDIMFIDEFLGPQLSPAQLGVLVVHEALYLIANRLARVSDSVPVRDLMEILFQKKMNKETFCTKTKAIGVGCNFFEEMATIGNFSNRFPGNPGILFATAIFSKGNYVTCSAHGSYCEGLPSIYSCDPMTQECTGISSENQGCIIRFEISDYKKTLELDCPNINSPSGRNKAPFDHLINPYEFL